MSDDVVEKMESNNGDLYFTRKSIQKCMCGSTNVVLVRSATNDNYVMCRDCGKTGAKYNCSPIIVHDNEVEPKTKEDFKLDNDKAVKSAIEAWNKLNK